VTVSGNYIEAKVYCFTINEWLVFEVDMSGTEVSGLGEQMLCFGWWRAWRTLQLYVQYSGLTVGDTAYKPQNERRFL